MLGLKIFKITGNSMEPALKAGSYVLAMKRKIYQTRDIIVFRAPDGSTMIKRIKSIKSNAYEVAGDNPQDSLDSRDFGPIDRDKIFGKVIWY